VRGAAPPGAAYGAPVVGVDPPTLPNPAAARLLTLRQVAATTRARRVDLVQAPEWEACAWWIARTRAAPVITRLATPTYLVDALNGRPRTRATALVRRLERDQARRSAALVAPSRAIAERVAANWGLDAGAVAVIPNPLDLEAIRRAGESEPPIPLPRRFLAFIGRLEVRKGITDLASALPGVLARHPDVHVVVIGRDAGEAGGGATEALRIAARAFGDRVHLLGALPREHALAVLARAELVVLPSRWEAFGFVATEALALGRPVVATTGSGLAEVIEDGRSGWLVPPGDAAALEATLAARLGDPDALRRAGDEARRSAARYEAKAVAERLAALYERVLAERRADRFDRSIYTRGYRRHFRPEERGGPFERIYDQKRRAVLALLMDLPERSRVVDVGAGPGRLTAPLARRHAVTACDVSAEMLEEARRRSPPGVEFVQADARALPFEDGAFDALVALDLLAHLPDLPAALAEFSRIVRAGGMLLFDTSNAAPWWVPAYPSYVNWRPKRLVRTMLAGGVLPEWRDVVRHHRAGEARRAIAEARLELRRVRSFGPPWCPKWHLWEALKP
jgi:glycogen(starch) synthase